MDADAGVPTAALETQMVPPPSPARLQTHPPPMSASSTGMPPGASFALTLVSPHPGGTRSSWFAGGTGAGGHVDVDVFANGDVRARRVDGEKGMNTAAVVSLTLTLVAAEVNAQALLPADVNAALLPSESLLPAPDPEGLPAAQPDPSPYTSSSPPKTCEHRHDEDDEDVLLVDITITRVRIGVRGFARDPAACPREGGASCVYGVGCVRARRA
ncbi:hypothetical protein B0H13DRAFT_112594 [Mycena leptocephala]|nr:hypothetical protein B0H13DRAFT_112594 [Mycena leptocephala]